MASLKVIKIKVTLLSRGMINQPQLSVFTNVTRYIPAFLCLLAVLTRTTCPSIISSVRRSWKLRSQPPPIRNLRNFPVIEKPGDVIEPWGLSYWYRNGREGLGRFSKVPIHQSPLWLLKCPPRCADGISPYVGWLLNAKPVKVQFDRSWSSKSNIV